MTFNGYLALLLVGLCMGASAWGILFMPLGPVSGPIICGMQFVGLIMMVVAAVALMRQITIIVILPDESKSTRIRRRRKAQEQRAS